MARSDKTDKNYVLQSREAYTQKKYTVKRTRIVNSPVGNSAKGMVGGDAPEKQSSNKKKAKALFKRALDETGSKKEEAAKKQKKSSYIQQNVQNNDSASYAEQSHSAYSEQYDDFESEKASSDNGLQQNTDTKKSEEKPVHGGAKSESSVSDKKDVSEKAEQMKKAAFIKERLQQNIAASQKAAYYEQNEDISDKQNSKSTKDKDNTPSYVKEKLEGNNVVDSRYLGNSESISDNKHNNSLDDPNVKKAYKTQIMSDKLTERRMYAADMRSQTQTNAALIAAEKAKTAALKKAESESESKDSFSQLEKAAEYMSAVGSGDVAKVMLAKPAEDYLKSHLSSGTNAFLDKAGTVTGAVKNSESVGDAAANAGRTLITDAVKKSVTNALNKPFREKNVEERLEKKFHYIDRKTDKQMSRIQSEKREAMNGNISKGLEKKLDKIDRKQEQYREKLAKQQKELQRRQQKNIYIRHNRNNPAFVGGKPITKKLFGKIGNSKLVIGAGSFGLFFVGIMIILILLIIIAQTLAPIGWLFGKPDSDPAMVDTDDLEKLCVSAEKVKKKYSDRIKRINAEISQAINDSVYWYEDENGVLQTSDGTMFAVVENEFWHYSEDEFVETDKGGKMNKKIIDEMPIVYKGQNPEYWADKEWILPEDFDMDTATFCDIMNIDYLYEIISEDEFDFYEFCVYFQAYNIKKKYPEDPLEEHMDEMFELKDEEAQEFFERVVKYKATTYWAYYFANDTANGLPIYAGADPGYESLAINIFQQASFWQFRTSCYCIQTFADNCHGHPCKMFILKIVPYSEIFEEDEINITEEDQKVIDQLKESMKMLETEIIPEVMETYSGTYFIESEDVMTTTTVYTHADRIG